MITRIEIDGFKSFSQFALDLQPFQVIIGANGVGKSNLFDALMILSRLARGDTLFDAFQSSRGSVLEQFALLEDGSRSKQIQFVVEILLPKKFKDLKVLEEEKWIEVPVTRFRYEIRIIRRESPLQGMYIDYEELQPIPVNLDRWAKTVVEKAWLNQDSLTPNFITKDTVTSFNLRENRWGRLEHGDSKNRQVTALNTADFELLIEPIARSMSQWQSLQFNPSILKQPVSSFAPADVLLPDGSNLAAVMYRMSKEDEFALNDIARDMMSLNQNFKALEVKHDEFQDVLVFRVQDQNGNWLSPNVLSDGTLRTLAFVTLRNDPNYEGVLCIEEAENGVHPLVLEKLVGMFQTMATDFTDTEMPLRQVILNTHSPALLAYVDEQNIAYMYMPRHNPRLTAVGTLSNDEPNEAKRLFTKHQISNFLNATSKSELNHA